MMENCLSEGVIQAFLDGELAAREVETVTRHIALCDDCAILLSEAEEETSFAYTALEQEFNSLVPTQRLWVKINSSIEEERRNSSFWNKVLLGVSGIVTQLSRPSAAAFASLLLVIGVFSTLWVLRPVPKVGEIAVWNPTETTEIGFGNPLPVVKPEQSPVEAASDTGNDKESESKRIIQTVNKENFNKERLNNRSIKINTNKFRPKNNREAGNGVQTPSPTTLAYIPGEESYVKTISTLKNMVDSGKDMNLRPSERFVFEKDMAVIDDAIRKMQAEIKRNPKNEAARQVLFASYQNKIDLLNSVTERNELVASIR